MTLMLMGETCANIAQYLVQKGYPSHLSHGTKRGRRNVRNEEGSEVGEKVGKGRGGDRGLTFSNIIPSVGRTQFHEYLAAWQGLH